MSQREMVLRALADGPGTSAEVAIETGLPRRHVSALLSALHKAGRLKRTPYATGNAGARSFLYERRSWA